MPTLLQRYYSAVFGVYAVGIKSAVYRASVDFPATNRARGAGKRAGKAADCVSRVCKATATRRYAGGRAVLIRLLTRSSYIPTTRAVGRSVGRRRLGGITQTRCRAVFPRRAGTFA